MTARQAMGLFVGLLLGLGLAFFFGLMTGYSGRERKAPEPPTSVAAASPRPTPATGEAMPPVETGVPSAAAGDAPSPTPAPDPTPPATLHPFEDSAEEEATPTVAARPGSRTSLVGAAPTAAPAARAAASARAPENAGSAGRVWIQAASLTSHEEANALAARLSRHGFHSVVLAGSGPKGRIYRVRVGPYRSDEDAGRAVSKLSSQEKIREPWIVPEGK
jgi:cell division protein FtsN